MKNYLGDIIYKARTLQNLTQDEYGARYSVTGPAIFKFEKGFLRPSLELWVRMAVDAGLSECRAVLLWCKSKLPEPYQDFIELQSATTLGSESKAPRKQLPDYSVTKGRDAVVAIAEKDATLPKGLRALLADPELWALFKPTGKEINQLRDIFGPLGVGDKHQFREGLRLIREFQESSL